MNLKKKIDAIKKGCFNLCLAKFKILQTGDTAECDKYVFDQIQILNILRFSKSTNTKYQILYATKKIWIPNTKYYLVSIKSEYRIRIVIFSLTIQIPNTKYAIVYTILEKRPLKSKYLSYTRHIVKTIWTDIWTGIPIPE